MSGRGRGRGGSFGERGGRGDGGRGRGHGGGAPMGGRGGGRGGRTIAEVFAYQDELVPVPESKITKIEDDTLKSSKDGKSNLPDLSQLSLDQKLPRRPGYGTRGTPLTLWTNYFQLVPKGDLRLYRYSIDMQPEAAGKKRQRIVQQLLTEGRISALGRDIVSDYKSTLISNRGLHPEHLEESIVYKSEGEDEPTPTAQTYKIRLEENGRFTVSELIDYLTSTNASSAFAAKADIIQALNIILGYHPKSSANTFSVGANKHFALRGASAQSFDLGAGLQAWRGYFVSVRAAAARLLLNVQVKHVATFEAIPLGIWIGKHQAANGSNLYQLEKILKKLRIETHHMPDKINRAGVKIQRAKTITGLATKSDGQGLAHPPRVRNFGANAKDVQFWWDESASSRDTPTPSKKGGKGATLKGAQGKESAGLSTGDKYISVFDFFRRNYNRQLKTDVPVVNTGNKQNPMYLPVDVCVILPGQLADSKLSPNQTQQMIRFAVRKPYENARSIVDSGCVTLGLVPPNPTLATFGISVGQKMVTVPGRILTGPSVRYRQNATASTRYGSWNMENIKFTTGASLRSWTTLRISIPGYRDAWNNDADFLKNTLVAFHQALIANGVNANIPTLPGPNIELKDEEWDEVLNNIFKRLLVHPSKPELILVLLPKNDIKIYNRVKYYGDVVYGLHTICVVGDKFAKLQGGQRFDLQYFANVALKINLKKGGTNQSLDPSKLGIVSQGKTMVVGIDVTHPSPGSSSDAPSVAGMVASYDKWLGQWPATLRIQEARKEMVSELGEMLISRLHLWRAHNKQVLPENIIVYRDGVSEGQYAKVLDEELPLLQKTCAMMYPATDTKKGLPKLAIIVVGKRHHTRFYPTSLAPNTIDERSSNPKNGTVVDRGITEPRNWDFFLQAHTALQGTARPAHYFVVHDDIFSKQRIDPPFQHAADVLEDLTHNMCYMYGRATKAVSVCPPAYYADLVCERARCYLSSVFDASPGPTPSASLTSGRSGELVDQVRMVQIHDKLKDTMFYI